jgi:alkanesulfonate monooxygenase SsuD/methylene tetrahydromethanopterin reductase-like flavin-dependent oxidoreductase (luciferase family)
MVGTLDLISGGRVVLAVGAGGAFNDEQKREWQAAGVKASQRGRRLEEVMEVVKRLGSQTSVSFQGRHIQLDKVSLEPRPVQRGGVPILFACHLRAQRQAQFDRAGRLGDGYISISETPQGFAEIGRRVQQSAQKSGRDFSRMEGAFYMTVNLNRDPEKAREEADRYLKMYYGVNIWQDIWGPWGDPQETIESIRRYALAGARTVIVRFASFDPLGQMDTFIKEVVPAF